MSERSDPAIAAINDARALLDTLLAGGWQEAYVVSGDTEIFLARPGARANPMRHGLAAPAVTGGGEPAAPVRLVPVKAPHVASLVSTAAVGQAVAAGDCVAVISLLDEEIALAAPVGGRVESLAASPGSLLDYEAPILILGEVA